MVRRLLLWASQNRWLSRELPGRPFVRRAVRRFMPGEDRSAALREAGALGSRGVGVVFTLLGENVQDPGEVDQVVLEYEALLEEIRDRGLDGQISVKPTQLGLDLSPDLAARALDRLVGKAASTGSFVWIDMEATPYLEPTKALYLEARGADRPVGLCLQAYLRSSPGDVEDLLDRAPIIRVVKGAYAEPPELAFPRRREVDQAFFGLVTMILERGGRVGVATHDRRLMNRVRAWVKENGIQRSRYEFQMLFGIQAGEQARLAREGEPIRVLISYGPSWFPWYMRRLAERPANLWFVMRNLLPG